MSTETTTSGSESPAQLLEELRFSASLCADALESGRTGGEEPLAAAAQLVTSADRTLHRFVHDAREHGMSWTRIGETLGISRQAAQKRFSSPPQRVRREMSAPDPELVRRALDVMEHAATGEAAAIDAMLGARLHDLLGDGGIAQVFAGVEPIFGRCLSRGEPEARVIARITVVRAREHREIADADVRVSLTPEGRLLGVHYDFSAGEE